MVAGDANGRHRLMFLVLYIAIPTAAALLAGVLVYRWRVQHGQALAVFYGIGVFTATLLLVPLPSHGGFTTLAEGLVDTLKGVVREARTAETERRRHRPVRFAGTMPFQAVRDAGDGWQEVAVLGGGSGAAWLDTRSGMIYTDSLVWTDSDSLPALDEARAACAELPPANYWALPDAAELLLFARAGGERVSPPSPKGSVAELWQANLGGALAQYRRGATLGFDLRCVGRSATAPESGFSSADIPLDAWNDYQLRGMNE